MATQRTIPGQSDGLTSENYSFLTAYVHRESGIELGADKLYLLKSRLQPVLAEEHMSSLDQLCDRLRKAPPESLGRRIVESMTTHETLFFRDPAVFDVLRKELIPELVKARSSTKALRIWSAACSSAQEPYSVAMTLLEAGLGDWSIEIIGTDIPTQILDRAAAGTYLQIEVKSRIARRASHQAFPTGRPRLANQGQCPADGALHEPGLASESGRLAAFRSDPLRNVLIYFDVATRKRILSGIRSRLAPGGLLLLGASETTFNLDETFLRRMIVGAAVLPGAFRRKTVSPLISSDDALRTSAAAVVENECQTMLRTCAWPVAETPPRFESPLTAAVHYAGTWHGALILGMLHRAGGPMGGRPHAHGLSGLYRGCS